MSALQLSNERLRIGCSPSKNDPGWYALCSHKLCCSLPLWGHLSKLTQLIRNGDTTKLRFEFLAASLIFGSEALIRGRYKFAF